MVLAGPPPGEVRASPPEPEHLPQVAIREALLGSQLSSKDQGLCGTPCKQWSPGSAQSPQFVGLGWGPNSYTANQSQCAGGVRTHWERPGEKSEEAVVGPLFSHLRGGQQPPLPAELNQLSDRLHNQCKYFKRNLTGKETVIGAGGG